MEIWQESLVERQTANMLDIGDAEAVHAHLDEATVALTQILIYSRILGVEIYIVSCLLTSLHCKTSPVMPIVVAVVVDVISVFQIVQSCLILFPWH